MKRLFAFAFILMVLTACATEDRPAKQTTHKPVPLVSAGNSKRDDTPEQVESRLIPVAFRKFDFRNRSYQTSLRNWVRLREGERVIENPEGEGGDTFHLRDVH